MHSGNHTAGSNDLDSDIAAISEKLAAISKKSPVITKNILIALTNNQVWSERFKKMNAAWWNNHDFVIKYQENIVPVTTLSFEIFKCIEALTKDLNVLDKFDEYFWQLMKLLISPSVSNKSESSNKTELDAITPSVDAVKIKWIDHSILSVNDIHSNITRLNSLVLQLLNIRKEFAISRCIEVAMERACLEEYQKTLLGEVLSKNELDPAQELELLIFKIENNLQVSQFPLNVISHLESCFACLIEHGLNHDKNLALTKAIIQVIKYPNQENVKSFSECISEFLFVGWNDESFQAVDLFLIKDVSELIRRIKPQALEKAKSKGKGKDKDILEQYQKDFIPEGLYILGRPVGLPEEKAEAKKEINRRSRASISASTSPIKNEADNEFPEFHQSITTGEQMDEFHYETSDHDEEKDSSKVNVKQQSLEQQSLEQFEENDISTSNDSAPDENKGDHSMTSSFNNLGSSSSGSGPQKGAFIPYKLSFANRTDEEQAKLILAQIRKLAAQGYKKAGIIYSANDEQARRIVETYKNNNGNWQNTETGGSNQGSVIHHIETLLASNEYADLRSIFMIFPIATMSYERQDLDQDSVGSSLVARDIKYIKEYLDNGAAILGWQNQSTETGKYAIGGGVAKTISAKQKLSDICLNVIQVQLDNFSKTYPGQEIEEKASHKAELTADEIFQQALALLEQHVSSEGAEAYLTAKADLHQAINNMADYAAKSYLTRAKQNHLANEALKLVQGLASDDAQQAEQATLKFAENTSSYLGRWKMILGAVIGAAIGFIVGAMIGVAAGPLAALTALAAGAKGAIMGASLFTVGGAWAGYKCGFWAASQDHTRQHLLDVEEAAQALAKKSAPAA